MQIVPSLPVLLPAIPPPLVSHPPISLYSALTVQQVTGIDVAVAVQRRVLLLVGPVCAREHLFGA